MTRTVIIPLSDPQQDMDGLAERAIACAHTLIDPADSRVLLVSAIDGEEYRAWRQAYLDHIAGTIDGHVSTEIATGLAGDVILTIAAEREAEDPVIVMASHGRRGVQRRTLGSTAAAVARGAHCPLFILPANPRIAWTPPAEIRRVLLPMSDPAIADAFAHATLSIVSPDQTRETELHLVEVTPPIPPQPVVVDGDRFPTALNVPAHFLRRVAQTLTDEGNDVTWSLRIGDPAQELRRATDEEHVDLIALPAYGRSGFNRLVPDVIAEIARSSKPVPILLVSEAAMAAEIFRPVAAPLFTR